MEFLSSMNKTQTKICVSVIMITYNHEAFIGEAIEGVLMQEVDFEIELIIADDCSPDRTKNIVNQYIENHPKGNWIKYHRQEKNVGMQKNFLFALNNSYGKYVAICEGDDYWIDNQKLQKQVQYLENNPEYVIHFTNAFEIFDKSKNHLDSKRIINHEKDSFDIQDFISTDNPICTLTVLFKNIKELKNINFSMILGYPYGDWYLWIFLLYHSGLKVKYVNDVSANYRIHQGGVFSTKKPIDTIAKIIKIHELNMIHFPNISKQTIQNVIKLLKYKFLMETFKISKILSIKYYFSNYRQLKKQMPIRDFIYAIRKY